MQPAGSNFMTNPISNPRCIGGCNSCDFAHPHGPLTFTSLVGNKLVFVLLFQTKQSVRALRGVWMVILLQYLYAELRRSLAAPLPPLFVGFTLIKVPQVV
jgi:hypothetical protein